MTITLKTNYQLDLTKSNSYKLIGFDKKVLKTASKNVGTKVPNLSQDTDIVNIYCDLVNDSFVDGEESDIIYSLSISVLKPSHSFTLEPRRITYNPINKQSINSITSGTGLVRVSAEGLVAILQYFHQEHFIDPTNCPWVSEDAPGPASSPSLAGTTAVQQQPTEIPVVSSSVVDQVVESVPVGNPSAVDHAAQVV